MATTNKFLVRVHAEWNGWRSADVLLSSLEGLHWHQPPGAPRALLHAFVLCTAMLGPIPHACDHSRPHRVQVCVLKRHALPAAYEDLARRADEARS